MEMARLLGITTSRDNGQMGNMVDGRVITQYTDSTGGQHVDCILVLYKGLSSHRF